MILLTDLDFKTTNVEQLCKSVKHTKDCSLVDARNKLDANASGKMTEAKFELRKHVRKYLGSEESGGNLELEAKTVDCFDYMTRAIKASIRDELASAPLSLRLNPLHHLQMRTVEFTKRFVEAYQSDERDFDMDALHWSILTDMLDLETLMYYELARIGLALEPTLDIGDSDMAIKVRMPVIEDGHLVAKKFYFGIKIVESKWSKESRVFLDAAIDISDEIETLSKSLNSGSGNIHAMANAGKIVDLATTLAEKLNKKLAGNLTFEKTTPLGLNDLTGNWEAVLKKYVSGDKGRHTCNELIASLENQLRIKSLSSEDPVQMTSSCFRKTVDLRIKNTDEREFDLHSKLKDECKARAEQNWLELHPNYLGRLFNSHRKPKFIAQTTEAIALDELQNNDWLANIGVGAKELAYNILRLGEDPLIKDVPKERIHMLNSHMPSAAIKINIPIVSSSRKSLRYEVARVRLAYSRPVTTVAGIASDNLATVEALSGYGTVGRIPAREIERVNYAINGLVSKLESVGRYNEDKANEKLMDK